MKRLPLISFAAALLLSCTATQPEAADTVLVIDGWIDDGGFPVVMVTSSASVTPEGLSAEDMDSHVMRFAKVTVDDGQNSVILTGMPDKRYYPPYIYTTGHLRGEAGKTYNLSVSCKGMEVHATTTIPEKVALESVEAVRSETSDTLYSLALRFTDDRTQRRYYQNFVKTEGQDSCYRPALMGVLDNAEFPPGQTVLNIYPEQKYTIEGFSLYFPKGRRVYLKFCTTDEAVHSYWESFQNSMSFTRLPLFPVRSNIKSNIEGGYGLWAGYGASFYEIVPGD